MKNPFYQSVGGPGDIVQPVILRIPEKTPVNAVAASGVVTFTGTPLVHVDNVQSSGTVTITGTPLSVANVDAIGTVTVTGTPVADEHLTIASQEFHFKELRTGVGEIAIDTNNTTQAANIVTAIAADLAVSVTATNILGVVHITSVDHGIAGNSLALTTDATGVAVSGSGTLSNGVDAVVETLTVDNHVFTFKSSGTAHGDIVISATPATQAANIVTSITRDLPTVTALSGTGGNTHIVTITAVVAGAAGDSVVLDESATGVAVSLGGILSGGVDHVHEAIMVGTQEFIFVTARSGAGSFEITVNADPTTQAGLAKAAINADVTNVTTDNIAGVLTVTAATKGVIGNLIVLSETATGTAVSSVTGGKLDGGIDGTIGLANELCANGSNLYHCIADNTIADANWRSISLGSAY